MLRHHLCPLLLSILLVHPLLGAGEQQACEYECEPTPSCQLRHQFVIGPQWIHLTRKREGGVKQQGNLYGAYFTYDRLKRYGWYLGAEGSYARATLKGDTDEGDVLHSKFKDCWIEGRFGYTFQKKSGRRFALTPYLGLGYAQEQNNFGSSSPLPIHFKSHFYYPLAGLRLSLCLGANFNAALNFRVRWPYDPKCKVTNDPDHDSMEQKMGEKLQYRVELPLTYVFPCYRPWGISICPFYEYRPYGEHINYPFDYFKTTLTLWGVGVGLRF